MLKAYEKVNGVSLLGQSGVSEETLLHFVHKFAVWCEKNPKKKVLHFFWFKNRKTVNALALLGLRDSVNELSHIAEHQSADKKQKERKKSK